MLKFFGGKTVAVDYLKDSLMLSLSEYIHEEVQD